MSESKVFWFQGDDADMIEANVQARATFKFFWRECFWERQRIIPALDMAVIKAPFWDGGGEIPEEGQPVEHMWVSELDFDGETIRGTLINQPNQLHSVNDGDAVAISAYQIDDWMFASIGLVYGAYTVNLMRSRMAPEERRAHDEAWGLDFGDPSEILLFPVERAVPRKQGFFAKLFGKKAEASSDAEHDWVREHLMSKNMGPTLPEFLDENPQIADQTFDHGFTMLHMHALAGNISCIPPLLAAGFDPQRRDSLGRTPKALAASQDWDEVAALLSRSSTESPDP